MNKMNKKAIIGGFTVDFYAIIAIFIILAIYLAASWFLSTGGIKYIDNENNQYKMNQLLNSEQNLDLFMSYENSFNGKERSSLEFVKIFFDNYKDLDTNHPSYKQFKDFFSNINIEYLEINKDKVYIYCIKGVCQIKDPDSRYGKTDLSANKRDYIEINLLGVNITLSNVDLSNPYI